MAYGNKKKLPDTPWHVGYAYKNENDPRRHKARCIHLDKMICKCSLSGCYLMRCAGSSHCKCYSEEKSQWVRYLNELITDEERNEQSAETRAALYRKERQEFVQAQLLSSTYHKRYKFLPAMVNCPFCRERMRNLKCNFCLAKFKVVTRLSEEEIKRAAEEGYFLIKKD